jgi:Ca-activated chloride channel family protein
MSYLKQLDFASPWVFSLLLLPVLFVAWRLWRGKKTYPSLRIPSLLGMAGQTRPWRGLVKQYLFVLRALASIFLIVALARPQIAFSEQEVSTDGIDIVLALDVSGSMKALDFDPNRLEAAKVKAAQFIEARPNDRMGLVVFAGESFTQCPVTTDHEVVKLLLKDVKDGLIEDGTAIGMGLATAVSRLQESETQSKVVILLTDGENNAGFIDPATAVEAAVEYGIRVYTIGVGTKGIAKIPQQTPFGTIYQDAQVNIDEDLLKEIAQKTGGKYFRATSNEALSSIYEEIDQLETSRLQVSVLTRKTEEFTPFLLLGLALLALELILRYAVVRAVP